MFTSTWCSRIVSFLSFAKYQQQGAKKNMLRAPLTLLHVSVHSLTHTWSHTHTHMNKLSGVTHFLTPDPAGNTSCLTSASPQQFVHCLSHMTENCILLKIQNHLLKLKWFVRTLTKGHLAEVGVNWHHETSLLSFHYITERRCRDISPTKIVNASNKLQSATQRAPLT